MNYMRSILLNILFLVCVYSLSSQEKVKVWEEPLIIPTYEMNAPDKNPMFFKNQSYQGASRYIYPYALEDNLTDKKVEKTYKALYLENEYLKLCVLPEIGGRLFYATDKTNGYEIFYRQNVIKRANIGMLGAWISGGVEFCVFHHHRASTNIPVDYKLEQNEDGSATIWIGETEPRHRMKWTLGIKLYPGKSYLEVDGRMFNPTDDVNSILYWANVATHVNEDYQVIFPPSTDFAVFHAKNSFAHWPVTSEAYVGKDYYKNNIDASWWKNHPDPVSLFAYDIKEGFLAGYDHGQKAGTMHIGNHHIVKGAKLWEWGPGAYGTMWDSKVLTDVDGPYAELMSGAYSDNQPDYSWIKPNEYKTFKQFWYPLRETEGAVTANLNATLNFKKLNDKEIFVAVNSTQVFDGAVLSIENAGKEVFQTKIDVSPSLPFNKIVKLANIDEKNVIIVLKDSSGEELLSYHPVKKENDLPLPDPVVPPSNPKEIKSIEELYLTGLRIKQFHNARINPEIYFEEALHRDPLDTRSNTMMGIIRKQEFKLNEAAQYFRKALHRLTANYTRPRDCEPLYHLGVTLKLQGKNEAAYDTLYRSAWDQDFASAAYYNLSQISAGRRDYKMALTEVNRSLAYNSSNLNAHNLKSSILRALGKYKEAKEQVHLVLKKDALNFRAINEGVLLGENQPGELWTAMRGNPESYLELATEYLNSGFADEARAILEKAVISRDSRLETYPTIHYYLGFLYGLDNNTEKSEHHYKLGKELPTDYCFPYRFESIQIYKNAIKNNPDDARAYYYLGNLLYDRHPESALKMWEKSVELEPSLAVAHRNLGWGYDQTTNNLAKAIASYETAIKHNKSEPRYFYELDKLYEKNGTAIQKRYAMLTTNHDVVSQRPDALLQEIQVMLLYGNSGDAIEYLVNTFFPRQEGVDNLHGIYVDACLSKGISELNDGNYQAALDFFKMADQYPENHFIARNEDYERNAQIFYYQAQAHKLLGNKSKYLDLLDMAAKIDARESTNKYYNALALKEKGSKKEALSIAESIKKEGEMLLTKAEEIDFFSKFGEGQLVEIRQARANFLLALACLVEGDKIKGRERLESSQKLNSNDLWVKLYLKNLEM